jgi:hypothetical protein
MSYEVVRVYKNYADQTIRIDTLYLEPEMRAGTATSGPRFVSPKRILDRVVVHGNEYDTDRTVASIELSGSFDDYESTSGNYTWVKWNTGSDDAPLYMKMGDLPALGDSI